MSKVLEYNGLIQHKLKLDYEKTMIVSDSESNFHLYSCFSSTNDTGIALKFKFKTAILVLLRHSISYNMDFTKSSSTD